MSYVKRIKLCYNQKIMSINGFDRKTALTINNLADGSSIPSEYLIPAVISGAAHSMGGAVVNPFGNWMQPSTLFIACIGFSGTNKSTSLEIVKKALEDVEAAMGVTLEQSRLNQCKYDIVKLKILSVI